MRDLGTLTLDDFSGLVGEPFRVGVEAGAAFEVTLVEVTEIDRDPGGRSPFSLLFRGGPTPPLSQRIYRVEHDQLGQLEIFLVPIAADRYQAVFS